MAETSFHVRYAETDSMGIVHHATYIVWFEEGRSALMRTCGASYTAFEADGVQLTVSEVQARYLAPARYDQLVTVRCWVERIQSRKMRFRYLVYNAESKEALATGYSDHVCITSAGKVARIPDKWRKFFKRAAS